MSLTIFDLLRAGWGSATSAPRLRVDFAELHSLQRKSLVEFLRSNQSRNKDLEHKSSINIYNIYDIYIYKKYILYYYLLLSLCMDIAMRYVAMCLQRTPSAGPAGQVPAAVHHKAPLQRLQRACHDDVAIQILHDELLRRISSTMSIYIISII